jgi:GGDEF domain-containing protein/predicted transcriptional regulator
LSSEQFAALLKTRECAVNPAGCCPEEPEAPQVSATEPSPPRSLYLVASKSAARCEQMGDVAQVIAPVSPMDRITSVLGRFQREMDLKVLPVVEDGAVVGMVNRSTFLEEHIIGRHGFGAHINHSKKIRDLMEPLAISLDAAMPVEEAARMLQPTIGTLRIDNVCITKNGAYAGVLDVNRYLKAMTEIQMVLAKGANPLTGLPGNTSIEREISSRLEAHVPFDIAYLDIDNFKPFNDHYGFQKGDEVIRKLAEIMETVAASVPAEKTFCGHIGGDDFILITESLKAERLSLLIIAAFEAERSIFHGTRDCALGGYRAVNRKGEPENFSLISLSVGIVNTSLSQVGTYAKLASLSTEVKKAAKKRPGSTIVVDGRRRTGERSANGLEVA